VEEVLLGKGRTTKQLVQVSYLRSTHGCRA
jgi:hypothetical protein